MKIYYFAKFEIETLSELFDNSSFDSIVSDDLGYAIKKARKFKSYLKKNHPETSNKYKIFQMTIKKVK